MAIVECREVGRRREVWGEEVAALQGAGYGRLSSESEESEAWPEAEEEVVVGDPS